MTLPDDPPLLTPVEQAVAARQYQARKRGLTEALLRAAVLKLWRPASFMEVYWSQEGPIALYVESADTRVIRIVLRIGRTSTSAWSMASDYMVTAYRPGPWEEPFLSGVLRNERVYEARQRRQRTDGLAMSWGLALDGSDLLRDA